jgi:hypothetical protein
VINPDNHTIGGVMEFPHCPVLGQPFVLRPGIWLEKRVYPAFLKVSRLLAWELRKAHTQIRKHQQL